MDIVLAILLLASAVLPDGLAMRRGPVAHSFAPPGCVVPQLAPQDTWVLAGIIAGEASVACMGQEAATALAWTVRNRLAACESWPGVQGSYLGRAHPTAAEWQIALAVLAAPAWEDPTGGARWAMSAADVQRWGFRPADLIYVGPTGYELHLYRTSPFVVADPHGR